MLRECFNDFIGHLRLERGLSLRTAKAYGSDMELFIRFLESRNIDEWEEVRRDDEDFFKVFCICLGTWYILSLPCCLFWNLCGRNAVNRVRLGTKQP